MKRQAAKKLSQKAPVVVREFWRTAYERCSWNKYALECYLKGRRRESSYFAGSQRWPIEVVGNSIYAWKVGSVVDWVLYERPVRRPVGKLFGKYVVLHAKRAPRWLKNWAKTQDNVFVLPRLDRDTLAAYLVQKKLSEAT